ncbi:cytochrome c family protein [Roseococcus sp. SDR]|uniref:c-type cytochrome n=1 Tax=Roseococcus sp. SDR TaxID=2835532 RepID=UPI001BCAA461|nr:cytochrome c family protein [Roseococcus sp. SDR]MBS7793042.1 cytochrome c family protein [Roseococcus sp. SDR]MBV1848356.1 cytochrome c family protein [Roseococcus sp. SDR]
MRVWMMAAAALALAPMSGAMAQDADAGQRVFNQCRACHTINQGGRNGVGPNLYGVWGRAAGAVDGFRYSAPMRTKAGEGLVWNADNLRAYLTDPKAVVPAGSMSFAGIRNEQQLNDLLAYLERASTAQ